ncbi:MAG: ferritin, partial [Gaiellales bacterium]
MVPTTFSRALNEQIGHEFGASQQYVAIAVYYDSETLPQLASHFYQQAVEERNHAMMMVQYLLDADAVVSIPAVEAPQTEFADASAPVRLALAHEQGLPISGRKLESTENVWDRFSVWADGLTNLLAHRRAPIQADLTHWFRFPHQGRAGWIRSTSFRGEVWMENQQLSIKANAGADRGQFVRDVLESRLGMIRGQIDQ